MTEADLLLELGQGNREFWIGLQLGIPLDGFGQSFVSLGQARRQGIQDSCRQPGPLFFRQPQGMLFNLKNRNHGLIMLLNPDAFKGEMKARVIANI
jgi:hypothetical protein